MEGDEDSLQEEEEEEEEEQVREAASAPSGCGEASAGVVLSPSLPGAGPVCPDGGGPEGRPLSPL